MITRNITHLDNLIVRNLHRIRSIPADVIVHCPRSGTIPASLIATYLCKPMCSVDEYCAGIIPTRKSEFTDLNRILLVDDSISTGQQMAGFIRQIKSVRPEAKIYTLAAYSFKGSKHKLNPTIILETHDDPDYIYTWFMWKTFRLKWCAVDMDGVLCRDVVAGEDDDNGEFTGEQYARFLETAELKFKPFEYLPDRDVIGAIVTGRMEKYRPQTESWLKRNGIKYNKLIMCPAKTKEERRALNPAKWKASIYKSGDYKLFIESSTKEAPIIASESGKPVFCVDDGKQYG